MAKTKILKMTRTEKQVAEQVVQAAQALGIELKRRNVGGFTNPSGRYVACAEPDDADYYATLPDGRHLDLELKKEEFWPPTARGKERDRFQRQVAKLRKTNESNGVGLWVRSSEDFLKAMIRILAGCRVEIDDEGFCWITDEPK